MTFCAVACLEFSCRLLHRRTSLVFRGCVGRRGCDFQTEKTAPREVRQLTSRQRKREAGTGGLVDGTATARGCQTTRSIIQCQPPVDAGAQSPRHCFSATCKFPLQFNIAPQTTRVVSHVC